PPVNHSQCVGLLYSPSMHHISPSTFYPLSLHDALPISECAPLRRREPSNPGANRNLVPGGHTGRPYEKAASGPVGADYISARVRSEEHTSELQSRFDLVCRLLLEKKKIKMHSVSQ